MMQDDWTNELRNKVRKLRSNITFTDYNMMNRRLDMLGSESTYQGFSKVFIYYQLSTKINIPFAQKLILIIHRCAGPSHVERYDQYFMNDEEGKLIRPRVIASCDGARRMIRDYYQEYASKNEKYSRQLNMLAPNTNVNQFRAKKELYVVVHDHEGITILPEILDRMKCYEKRWLFVCLDKEHDPYIRDLNSFVTAYNI